MESLKLSNKHLQEQVLSRVIVTNVLDSSGQVKGMEVLRDMHAQASRELQYIKRTLRLHLVGESSSGCQVAQRCERGAGKSFSCRRLAGMRGELAAQTSPRGPGSRLPPASVLPCCLLSPLTHTGSSLIRVREREMPSRTAVLSRSHPDVALLLSRLARRQNKRAPQQPTWPESLLDPDTLQPLLTSNSVR
eukprot:758317-Hanusia_phi.AAC.2